MDKNYEPEWSNYMQKFNKPNSEFFICDNSSVEKFCVIVEPRSMDLTILAIKNFLYLLQDKCWGLIIFHGTDNETFIKNKLQGIKNINYFNINKQNLKEEEYNDLLCSQDFWKKIKSCGAKNALIFQSDTLLLKNNLDDFLHYDYVGAPWHVKWMGMIEVGNGGLSLRNVDKMLHISKYCPRLQYMKNEDVYFGYWCIMREFKIAPVDVAKMFSVETVYYESPCGLHKPHIDKFPNREAYSKMLKYSKKELKEPINLKKDTKVQIRIRFFSSFCDGQVCKSHYETDFESELLDYYGPDKNIYITNDDDYTHAVIMNTAMPILKADIPKENVIGLAFEPIYFLGITGEFVEYAKQYISRYFIGDKKNLPSPFVEHTAYMWHTVPLKVAPSKNKLMSVMISEKSFAPGHKYRHELVTAILQSNLPIDIYGRGCANFQSLNGDPRLKGEFNDKEPYESYHFHICIENFKCNEYFSEKIINPLLCSAMPIYFGCNNIKNYFDEEVICLEGDLKRDMDLLMDIVKEPMKHYKRINVEKIKNKTNFLRNISEIFLLD
jgi:hypothetical protein